MAVCAILLAVSGAAAEGRIVAPDGRGQRRCLALTVTVVGLVGGECFGVPPAAVQGKHQLVQQRSGGRSFGDPGHEVGDDRFVMPGGQLGGGPRQPGPVAQFGHSSSSRVAETVRPRAMSNAARRVRCFGGSCPCVGPTVIDPRTRNITDAW